MDTDMAAASGPAGLPSPRADSKGSATIRSGAFNALMARWASELQAQHDRELEALRSEVERLRHAQAATPKRPASAPAVVSETPSASEMSPALFLVEVSKALAPASGDEGPSPFDAGAAPCVEAAAVRAEPPAASRTPAARRNTRMPSKLRHAVEEEEAAVMGFRQRGRALLQGNSFEMAIGTLIILNVFSIYLQLEFVGYEAGVLIGVEAEADLPGAELAVFISSYFFTLVFLVELLAKMYFLRCELWYSGGRVQKFNIFDTFVVLLTVVDLWILSPMQVGFNVSVLRVIRFLRVFRALRVVRAFEVFSKLRVLVATVSASFFALFWSMVLLSIVMLLAALGMCQAINTNLVDPGVDSETKLWSYRYYGTPSRALWTVFELTFSGGWPNYARVLVEKVSPLYAVPFAMYIAGIIFAMFRIITALFLKDTLSIAAADADMVIQDKMREKHAYAMKLKDFFEAADCNCDGFLMIDEFESVLEDERITTYLASLELDVTQTKLLFAMLDDGDQRISVDEFVKGAIRLKGQARSQDVIAIMHDCTKMMKKLEGLQEVVVAALSGRSHADPWAPPAGARTREVAHVVVDACVDL